ncbi:MAG: calcium-binding protein [Cyanobacteria bacterium P01_E01_bin.35]
MSQLQPTITLEDGQKVEINESIVAPVGQPGVDIVGDNTKLNLTNQGAVTAPDEGNTGVLSSGNNVEIANEGEISGAFNGISSTGDSFTLRNGHPGIISSDSRAVDLSDGDNITVENRGTIIGTGNQRNGTFYIDGTVDNLNLTNFESGIINAGEGNLGDGISVQVGAEGDLINDSINITNHGIVAGRGQAEFSPEEGRLTANGSSGVRFFNGSDAPEATVTGSLINTGSITSEVNVGFLGGLVVEDGVSYQGDIANNGLISGSRNGLYIGNAEHQLEITNEANGRIESGSRAVNLDGDDVSFENFGTVVGTDSQRNGTLYVDGTGDNIEIENQQHGVIDAGEGNSGSGVSIQVGTANGLPDSGNDVETSVDLVNDGLIQGRGTENVPAGVRLFLGSGLDAATFTGDITNNSNGVITSETDAGILIEDNITFNGEITNEGTIIGGNGLAIDASGALGDVDLENSGILEGDVLLGDGNDTLINNSHQALNINAGGGNDTLTGGSGVNVYSFALESGQDTITDFQAGQDVLSLGAYFESVDEVFGSTTQDGHDALIDLGNDNSITLVNVGVSDLTAESFAFTEFL